MSERPRWIQGCGVFSLFPTFVWKFELTPEARDTVNRQLLEEVDRLRPPDTDLSPGRGWQSHHELHTLASCRPLVSHVEDAR